MTSFRSMDRYFNDTFVTTNEPQQHGVNYNTFLNYYRVYCQQHELNHQDDEGKIRKWLLVDKAKSIIPNINGCSAASNFRLGRYGTFLPRYSPLPATFLYYGYYRVFSDHRCVLPYKHRTILEMLFKMINLCNTLFYGV